MENLITGEEVGWLINYKINEFNNVGAAV